MPPPADADHGDTPRKLRQAFLQLLAIVIRGRLLDLLADLRATTLDVVFLAAAVDDRGVLFLDTDALGLTQDVERDVLELDPQILADDLAAGQDRHVFEHRLAPVAEPRSLNCRDFQTAAQFVDDQGHQGLALDVLGDDQQRLMTGREGI